MDGQHKNMDVNELIEWMKRHGRVYILGAGFSHNFGLPLTSNFIPELIKECKNEYFINHINSVCQNFFPSFRAAYANYPNVEDLYNYYYSLTNYYLLVGSKSNNYVTSFFPEFLHEVALFLDRKVKSIPTADERYLKEFCEGLSSGDVIITFNWDNLVERYLEKYEVPYALQLSADTNKVSLLKLHGSIDWVKSKEVLPKGTIFQPVVSVNDNTEHIFRNKQNDFADSMKADKALPFFVPPLGSKDEVLKPLGPLWHQAYWALRNRLSKVYIGYSLPKEDTMARVLFSSYRFMAAIDEDISLKNERIRVINPDENASLNFKKYCSDNIEFWCTTYKTYVDAAIGCRALSKKLYLYKDRLLDCSDKFIQSVAVKIFDEGVYPIDALEKTRVKEYLKEYCKVDIEF